MIQFAASLGLMFLALIPLIEWLRRKRPVRQNLSYRVDEISTSWRLQLRSLLFVLRILGLILLAVSLASPFDPQQVGRLDVEGIAIELVLDRSGSMRTDDYSLDGRRVSRLKAVTSIAADFVAGQPVTGEPRFDSIGLVAFAAQPELAIAPTLDHEAVAAELERTTAASDFREDGTAIGDALAAAVAELRNWGLGVRKNYVGGEPSSKVAILLTDGQQNAGMLNPLNAFALAERFGVRVYVIGLEPKAIASDAARERIVAEQVELRRLAESTGGKAYVVSDSETLRAVYRQIDELERTPIEASGWFVRRHWAVSWFEVGPFGFPPLLVVSLIILSLDSVCRSTLLMEFP